MGPTDHDPQSIGSTATNGAGAPDGNQPEAPAMSASTDAPEATASSQAVSLQWFNVVIERLDRLQESFNSKLAYDEKKSQEIDFLHGEVRQVRERLFQQTLRPLYLSLIRLHDLIGEGRRYASQEAGAEGTMMGNLLAYQSELEEILMNYGVETYRTEPGTDVNRAEHLVRETLPATEPAQNNTIAKSQRPGFRYEGNVLRPEWVKAYRFDGGN